MRTERRGELPGATRRTYITEAGGTGKDKIHISIVSINETNEQIRQRASEGRVWVTAAQHSDEAGRERRIVTRGKREAWEPPNMYRSSRRTQGIAEGGRQESQAGNGIGI